jgi:hypothetical protein
MNCRERLLYWILRILLKEENENGRKSGKQY